MAGIFLEDATIQGDRVVKPVLGIENGQLRGKPNATVGGVVRGYSGTETYDGSSLAGRTMAGLKDP